MTDEPFAWANPPGDCINWTGNLDQTGRPTCQSGGRAYVRAWVAVNGPVPTGLQIDHRCRNVSCVNPDHLEAVTPQENNRRQHEALGTGPYVTHCPAGHEYTPENTYVKRSGWRNCVACHRLRMIVKAKDKAFASGDHDAACAWCGVVWSRQVWSRLCCSDECTKQYKLRQNRARWRADPRRRSGSQP